MANTRTLRHRTYQLKKTDNGYTLSPPAHRGLVLSGGGEKAIAYAGMIRAMANINFFNNLTHISGTSAGAITACILGIGVDPMHAIDLIQSFEISLILDNPSPAFRAKGERLRNVIELIIYYQCTQHLALIESAARDSAAFKVLAMKLEIYKGVLAAKNIFLGSFDDVLSILADSKQLRFLDKAFEQLPKQKKGRHNEQLENQRITFGDCTTLRALLPQQHQYLIKHFSVGITNQTKRVMQNFNEQESPFESIAAAVRHSAAHPILFSPGQNGDGDYMADGGISDNMPTEFMHNSGLSEEEIICVGLEIDSALNARIANASKVMPETVSGFATYIDDLAEVTFGGRFINGITNVINREKVFYYYNNMLYLSSGTITSTSIAATKLQKEQIIKKAQQQSTFFFLKQCKSVQHPFIAMLYLGEQMLKHLTSEENQNLVLIESGIHAKAICQVQQQIVIELASKNYRCVRYHLVEVQRIIGAVSDLDDDKQKAAQALCLKQINYVSEGKLEAFIAYEQGKETHSNETSFYQNIVPLLQLSIECILSVFKPCSRQCKIKTDTELSFFKASQALEADSDVSSGHNYTFS